MVSEIDLRRRPGEQGAAAAMAGITFPRVYSCKHCRLAEKRREYWIVGFVYSMGEPF